MNMHSNIPNPYFLFSWIFSPAMIFILGVGVESSAATGGMFTSHQTAEMGGGHFYIVERVLTTSCKIQ